MNLDERQHLEQQLLGTLLLLHRLAPGVDATAFLFPAHQAIYEAMAASEPDVCAVWDTLKSTIKKKGGRFPRWHWESEDTTMTEALSSVGGAAYLGELLDNGGTAEDLPAMIARVQACPRCGK